ncbi:MULTISPECIES: tetratricopeptide repeat protein [unclassified Amycolatopsis]|uniref:tetratricopeptide repeat protein n=1 Tax=unclassified Amycolatopsis TaxID=2618356 RepID=UPI0028765FA1|nr:MULTISPECIES: tetratricopeptide repeat protein [unclassified Amycolatopsis]MDS0137518.1 tetratricopeptide repeat protein [Amycolatopsis sp. 505]MDS0141713.1 tetratricopeptide repeat protein [Amycolatopsis sp. CM201R]
MAFTEPPDPGLARTLAELIGQLRLLKAWAGGPSYAQIAERVNRLWTAAGRPPGERTARTTVADCFKTGRARPNTDLLLAVVEVLHPDPGYVGEWQDVLRVVRGRAEAATFVQAQLGLPEAVPHFTGRRAELARLGEVLGTGGPAVIAGMAGVGKTGLAVQIGHELVRTGRCDNALFVNLRGFHPDPGQPPVDPGAVLDSFLRLFGVPGHAVPADLAGKTRVYRERSAGRRLLVVLDNAGSEDQVRPLLPGERGGPVLVTSRLALAGLAGATPVPLDVLSPDDAFAYLRRTVGAARVDQAPGVARRITAELGRLPLALSLAALWMTAPAHRSWLLADHLERLEQRRAHLRLDNAVDASISLSYDQLAEPERRVLRLLALHPGADLDAYGVAALAGTGLAEATRTADRLVAASLVRRGEAGRFELHDLIRAFGMARAQDEDAPAARKAAVTRLLDYYTFAAATAMDQYAPRMRDYRFRVPDPGLPIPPLTDREPATAWLDAERANLVGAGVHGVPSGHAGLLSRLLFRYLQTGGHLGEALVLHTSAAESADPIARGHALLSLAATHGQVGRYDVATRHAEEALACFRGAGDRSGECRALGTLGAIASWNADFVRSARFQRETLSLARELGDRAGERTALTNLGFVYGRLGWYAEALESHLKALAMDQRSGDLCDTGRTLLNIGDTHLRSGSPAEACTYFRRATAIAEQAGDRDLHVEALLCLAEASQELGRTDDARTTHECALAMAAELGSLHAAARAHTGLARALTALGDPEGARRHWLAARERHRELGLPESAEIAVALGRPVAAGG